MQLDKKTSRNILLILTGILCVIWVIRDPERAKQFILEIWDLATPFVIGSCIAFIFNVPMRFVERNLGWIRQGTFRRVLSMVLTLFMFVLVIAFIFLLLIPQIRITVDSLVQTLPDFFRRESANLMDFLEANPELRQMLLEQTGLSDIDMGTVMEKLITFAKESYANILDGAFSAIGSVTSGIVNTVLGICFAAYALITKESLIRQGRKLLYSLLSEARADEIIRVLRLSNVTFSNFFSGQCLEASILGLMFAISMAVLRLPYMPLVSVIIAVTSLVPYVGAFIGCVLGALFILVESPVQAVTFLIMFLVLQQIEGNLIYPRVVGTSIGLPGIWVLVSLTVGGELAGIAGMFIMIPLASVCYSLLREYSGKQLSAKQISEEKLNAQPLEFKSKFKENRQRRKQQRLLRRMKSLAEKAAHSAEVAARGKSTTQKNDKEE